VPRLARLAPLLAVLVLSACGHERPTEAVHKTVDRFGKAVADKDYQELCDNLLASNLIDALEESGVACELALKTGFADVKNPKLAVKTVAVNGDKALVTVHSTASNQPPSDDTLSLVKQKGKWKISSLAQPQPQAPAQP
jgi:Domain of unknown function (DUF4878)